MCEFWPKERGKNSTVKQKMMLELTRIKEEISHIWITSMNMELRYKS